MQMQTLMKEIFKWHCPFNLPGHSAVDAKVDRVGDADADVDHEDDILGQVVVHELVQAAIMKKIQGVPVER